MKKNNTSILNLHYGEQALSHCDLEAKGGLKSLWIEIPEYCHLYCDYCFASTNTDERRGQVSGKKINKKVQKEKYRKLIQEFYEEGGLYLGIPGRGEPFHPQNLELTKYIITLANKLGLRTTIFTTGDMIFFPSKGSLKELDIERKPNYDIVNFLQNKDVILLIKFNSAKEDVQDKIVHTKNYTNLRNKALDKLIELKNAGNFKPEIGIVTSILKSNLDEIVDLYKEYHINKHLIFDCDTILPRGRGMHYYERQDKLTHEDLKRVFSQLKDVGACSSCQGGTYVGVPCDRILHHLYVSLDGDVYPCIGCFENSNKDIFCLGNTKDKSLKELWNSPKRVKLRKHTREVFTGVCFNCQNFKDKTCYSCLGRSTESVTTNNAETDILIHTHGCTNHRPIFSVWVNQVVDYLRAILSFDRAKELIDNKLELLWTPNQNLAFKLHNLNRAQQIIEIEKIISVEDANCNNLYNPDERTSRMPVDRFSLKKHYKYSDLYFPLNKVWDFIKQPPIDRVTKEADKNKLLSEFSKSFLSNIFLPSLKILLEKYDIKNNVLVCNIMFYDNICKRYFYRTISKNETEDSKDYIFEKSLILFRWAENIGDYNYFSSDSKGVFFNVSSILRNEFYKEYELILRKEDIIYDKSNNVFDLSCFIDSPLIKNKVEELDSYFTKEIFSNTGKWKSISSFFNTKMFSDLDDASKKLVADLFEGLNSTLYSNKRDVASVKEQVVDCFKQFVISNSDCDEDMIKSINNCKNLVDIPQIIDDEFKKKYRPISELFNLLDSSTLIPLINYLVFLGYLHYKLGINHYLLQHSSSFKNADSQTLSISGLSSDYSNVINPSGILMCSKEKLSRDFSSDLTLFISNIFQPIDEYYFNKLIRVHESFSENLKAHQHTIFNISPHLKYNLDYIKIEVDNLIKIITSKLQTGDLADIKKEQTELKDLINEERTVFEIFDLIIKASLQEPQASFLYNKNLFDIIDYLCDYCNLLRDEKGSKVVLYSYTDKDKLYVPSKEDVIDIFTIFYNLLINANKASSYSLKLEVTTSYDNNKLRVRIVNFGVLIDDKICNFIENGTKPPHKGSGLMIVKKKAKKLDWKFSIVKGKSHSDFQIGKQLVQIGENTFIIDIPIKEE